jgi:hypothetical protein
VLRARPPTDTELLETALEGMSEAAFGLRKYCQREEQASIESTPQMVVESLLHACAMRPYAGRVCKLEIHDVDTREHGQSNKNTLALERRGRRHRAHLMVGKKCMGGRRPTNYLGGNASDASAIPRP